MIRSVLALALLATPLVVFADWTRMGKNNEGTLYADLSRVETAGDIRRVPAKLLANQQKVKGDVEVVGIFEFHCRTDDARLTELRMYHDGRYLEWAKFSTTDWVKAGGYSYLVRPVLC